MTQTKGKRKEEGGLNEGKGESSNEEFIIAAICENKAREIGLAVFEVGTAVLHLQQYVEYSYTYSISL